MQRKSESTSIRVIGAIDEQTRCRHYHSELDRIAIRFKCCDQFYGCYYVNFQM
ncbi:hypothetical protein XYCOK13_10920 [Xylanibacillus composti]|uniref:Uncharacterized protein n=1 Tax=Xylanibacillus composti TaxID=1572762 RepID=A0A8J4H499_9BACL|nr:hypothetical protein XYCOK13_10920 [Xylanibacillus composti]